MQLSKPASPSAEGMKIIIIIIKNVQDEGGHVNDLTCLVMRQLLRSRHLVKKVALVAAVVGNC